MLRRQEEGGTLVPGQRGRASCDRAAAWLDLTPVVLSLGVLSYVPSSV